MNSRRSITRTALVLLPLQLVFRAFDAAFPLLLAAWFGRSEGTDVYYFAWATFALAGSLVFSAFQDSAVVPVLAELRIASPASVPLVRGSLLAHTVVAAGVLAAAFGACASAWFCLRYTGPSRAMALGMIAPFCLYLVALALKTFFGAMLHAENRYFPLPVASAVGAMVTVAVIGASRTALSVAAIPVGSLAGEVVAVGVLVAAAHAARLTMTPSFARPEPVRRIARLVLSEVGGGAVTRANPVVDQLMAALTGVAGGGTLLKLSGDIASVPTSLLQATLLPVLLTHLSESFATRDVTRLRATVRSTLGRVLAVLAIASALFWLVRGPVLRVLFDHGAMDAQGIHRMTQLLPYHLAGLVPFGALLVFARAHVALQNSRIMVSMGILNAAVNLAMNYALVGRLGLEGLALATSVTYAVVALVFALRLRTRLSTFESTGAPAQAEAA